MTTNEYTDDWSDIESMMSDVLSAQSTAVASCATIIDNAQTILDVDLSTTQPSRLRSTSQSISSKINASIENERSALSQESAELATQLSLVQKLQNELSTLQTTNDTISQRHREAEEVIPILSAQANERVDELKCLESTHIKRLRKHKHELSLHALMTNIKWDYKQSATNNNNNGGGGNVLAGEVSMPNKAVHKRFVINKGELDEYEIAERLWSMIEG